MDIIAISQNILIVWWAIIVILWVIAMLYVIMILMKINYILKDVKYRYNTAMSLLFSPFEFVSNLLHKFSK